MMNRRRAWELVFSGFFLLAMFLIFLFGFATEQMTEFWGSFSK